MAYKKPNLYSMNRQEMLNNIAMSSNSGQCGATACNTNQVDDSCSTCAIIGMGSGCTPNSSNPPCRPTSSGCSSNSVCGTTSFNPTRCHISQSQGYSAPIDFESDDFISVDLDPHTNEIRITAGSAYPIEQLAELCRELYT